MTSAVEERPADTAPATEERPTHLAKCGECAQAVRFRPTATGASFVLVDAAPEASYGIGEHGRPLCPDGHGEMTIADDQLKPVPEAFANAQAMLQQAEREAGDGQPVQRTLPGVVPAFNYAGCFKELEDQAVLVTALESEHETDAKVARESKKKLEDAKDLLVAMTLKFRDRRRAKGPDPEETGARSPRLVKCTWEATHPDEHCPLCNQDEEYVSPMVLQEVFGNVAALPPADAEAHVESVERLNTWLETRETVDALEAIYTFIADDVITGWTSDERKAVTLYADQELDGTSGTADPNAALLERPSVLGRPHIPAAAVRTGDGDGYEPQICSVCEAVLPREHDTDAFQLTDLVGVDCSGKAPKAKGPDHHYPEKRKVPAKKAGKATGAKK
jgi:hypothetical protein